MYRKVLHYRIAIFETAVYYLLTVARDMLSDTVSSYWQGAKTGPKLGPITRQVNQGRTNARFADYNGECAIKPQNSRCHAHVRAYNTLINFSYVYIERSFHLHTCHARIPHLRFGKRKKLFKIKAIA